MMSHIIHQYGDTRRIFFPRCNGTAQPSTGTCKADCTTIREARVTKRLRPLRLAVVCLPGSGGSALADSLRHCHLSDIDSVRVVVVAPCAPTASVVPYNPFCVPCWLPDDTGAAGSPTARTVEAAFRHAARLRWLIWEMGIACDPTIEFEAALSVVRSAVLDAENDLVIVAAPGGQRWEPLLRTLQLSRRNLRVVADSPPSIIDRLFARLSICGQSRDDRQSGRRIGQDRLTTRAPTEEKQ